MIDLITIPVNVPPKRIFQVNDACASRPRLDRPMGDFTNKLHVDSGEEPRSETIGKCGFNGDL